MDVKPLEIKNDTRGSLVEAFKFPHDGQLHYIICNPDESRGNHYHVRKTEQFVVIYGSAVIKVKNRETSDLIELKTSGSKPMQVTVVPNHTHVITATKEGAIILAWADELYDEKDADTYTEEI